jgi:very-short-patch-repair endonuclease
VVYVDSQTKVAITCPTHGDFHQVPASHITGYGCIHCKNSIGEEKIFQLLKQNGIPFEAQKTFPELRLDLPLRLDFYLPEINTAIEFDGIQHQVALEIFGGEEGLKKRRERDRAKKEYCEANNIRMIRVWYNQNPENVLREHGIIP